MTVRTVLGDVAASDLGRVDMHDHLLIVGGVAPARDPDILLDSPEDALAEATAFAGAGGGAIVDAMPSACGRDAVALADVSRRSGVHVIATAGFHKQEYYGDLHWARRYPVDHLIRVILDECIQGIDRWDNAGPIVERTPVRPGLLKIATGYNAVRPMEERGIAAIAAVQQETGLSIITHADHGTGAMRQLDLLERHGTRPARVAFSHMDRNPDIELHADIAARGAYLIYDGLGRERYMPVATLSGLVRAMLARGFGDRLMLGGDVARRSARRSGGGSGIAGLLTELVPRLRRDGVSDGHLDAMLMATPAAFLEVRR